MHKLVQRVVNRIDHLNKSIGEALVWLIPSLIVLQFSIFLADKIYQFPLTEISHSLLFLNGLMLMLAIGYTGLQRYHLCYVEDDRNLNQKPKAIINLVYSLIFILPFAFAVFGYSSGFVINGWLQENSNVLEPVYKSIIFVYAYLIALMALSIAGTAFLSLTMHDEKDPAHISEQTGEQTENLRNQENSAE